MPVNGNSAKEGKNEVMTWEQGRRFLDARFVQMRERAIIKFSDPCALAIFLEVLNRKWSASLSNLRQYLLKQKQRRGEYRPTKTVNRFVGVKKKVRPRNSTKEKAIRKLKVRKRPVTKPRKRARPGRSHHRGEYTLLQPRPGRPKVSDAHKAKVAKHANARRKARRKAAAEKSGRKKYAHRRTKKEIAAAVKLKQARSAKIEAAREAWSEKHPEPRWSDDRKNHDPRYGYADPAHRERRGPEGKRKCHRRPGPAGNKFAALALIGRRILKDQLRRKHLRGYWREVLRGVSK